MTAQSHPAMLALACLLAGSVSFAAGVPDVLPEEALPLVVEIRPAILVHPIGKEAPAMWVNPLPPREYGGLSDDLPEHLRCHFNKEARLPLVYQAVLLEDFEWLCELLDRGLSADELTWGGDSALCMAVRTGQYDAVRVLLLAGADPNLLGSDKQPPLSLAALRRPFEVIEALLIAGAEPDTRFASPVSRRILDQVLIRDLKTHLENDRGVTPLMACAARGDVEGAAVLMAHGAKTSVCTSKFKRYPLNFAATQRFLFLMRILLGRPIDAEPDVLITVDLSQQRAWLEKDGRVVESTAISTGREGYATPSGRYVITDKHRTHTSTLYHVSMPWFMRLNCGAIGLHSGHVTGRPASHGCIRLPYAKAKQFFALAKVGDEVQIVR